MWFWRYFAFIFPEEETSMLRELQHTHPAVIDVYMRMLKHKGCRSSMRAPQRHMLRSRANDMNRDSF